MQLADAGGGAASAAVTGGPAAVSGPFASAITGGGAEVAASLGPPTLAEPPAAPESKRSKTRPVVSQPAKTRASEERAKAFASLLVGVARRGIAFGFVGQGFEASLPRMSPVLRLATLVCFVSSASIGCLSYSSPASDAGAGSQDPDATVPAADDGGAAANLGTVTIARDAGAPIPPFAFGQNYWDWVDWSANGVTGLTGTETLAGAVHLNVIRAGGDNNDTNSPQVFDTVQIDKFVAYCRAVGAEPILQVPLIANNVDGGAASAQAAADMVTYANGTKGYGVKYWEIGNEPDLYSTMYDAGTAPLTAVDYCTQFHTYATAMKAANAAAADGGTPIQLLGPELSYKYVPGNDWLTPFLDACKDDVDVVTIHRYPFSGLQTSVNGALQDAKAFQSTLTAVEAIVKAHARPNTPLGVTESNISYDYDQTKYKTASNLAAEPGTFYAALWTADALGVALQKNFVDARVLEPGGDERRQLRTGLHRRRPRRSPVLRRANGLGEPQRQRAHPGWRAERVLDLRELRSVQGVYVHHRDQQEHDFRLAHDRHRRLGSLALGLPGDVAQFGAGRRRRRGQPAPRPVHG